MIRALAVSPLFTVFNMYIERGRLLSNWEGIGLQSRLRVQIPPVQVPAVDFFHNFTNTVSMHLKKINKNDTS